MRSSCRPHLPKQRIIYLSRKAGRRTTLKQKRLTRDAGGRRLTRREGASRERRLSVTDDGNITERTFKWLQKCDRRADRICPSRESYTGPTRLADAQP
mmetsp:Transcript_45178/g.175324  ORF Transcript_45178/g.175324 Transcript_45178/m.175324 type:complete len:98 (-) Transcript_45178:3532-3825(-)